MEGDLVSFGGSEEGGEVFPAIGVKVESFGEDVLFVPVSVEGEVVFVGGVYFFAAVIADDGLVEHYFISFVLLFLFLF
jgi:hypothetical protein